MSTPVTPSRPDTVLVVDDEAAVRSLVCLLLRREGYAVLDADCAEEGLRLAAGHAGPIDLLVADLRMPGMDGTELATRLAAARPDLRVLYLSGDPSLSPEAPGAAAFMPKPFSPHQLTSKVRELLDA